MNFYTFLDEYKNMFFQNTNKVFDFEPEVMEFIHANKISLITKSRQMGLTNLYFLYMMWFVYFNNDSTRNEIIYINNSITDAFKKLDFIIGELIMKSMANNSNYNLKLDNFKLNNGSVQFNGNVITVMNESELDRANLSEVYMVILDDVHFNFSKNYNDFLRNLFNFNRIKISIGGNPNKNIKFDNHNLIINNEFQFYCNEYKLHYSKNPLWKYDKLVSQLDLINPFRGKLEYWNELMDCKYIDDGEPTLLTPYKDRRALRIENKLNNLINENI